MPYGEPETVSSEITLKVKSPPPKQSPGFEGVLVLGVMMVALLLLKRRK